MGNSSSKVIKEKNKKSKSSRISSSNVRISSLSPKGPKGSKGSKLKTITNNKVLRKRKNLKDVRKKRANKKSVKFNTNESQLSRSKGLKNKSTKSRNIRRKKLLNDSKLFTDKIKDSNELQSSNESSIKSSISSITNKPSSDSSPQPLIQNQVLKHDAIPRQSSNDNLEIFKHDNFSSNKLENQKSNRLESNRITEKSDDSDDEMAPVKFKSNLKDSLIDERLKFFATNSKRRSKSEVAKSKVKKESILKLDKEKSRSARECRICLQLVEDDTNILRPCACTGSQAYVHKSCLEEWIRVRGLLKCDICKREYTGLDLIKKHKGILNWIFSSPIVCAYLFAGLLVSFFFFYLFFLGYLEYRTSRNLVSNYVRLPFLLLTIIYIVLFNLALIGCISKGVIIFLNWRRENYTVTIGQQLINLQSSASTIDQQSINYLDPLTINQHPKHLNQLNQLPKSSDLSNRIQ